MFWPWGPTLESLPPLVPLWRMETERRVRSQARERVRRATMLLRRQRGRHRPAAGDAPGVAEVIEAYGRTAPPPGGWRPLNVGPLRYATGTEEEG